MAREFKNLSKELRSYINNRFGKYDISGEDAFYHPNIFSDELRSLPDKQIREILEEKDISHVMPVSKFPELEDDINNIFLEDSELNRARGADIMHPDEMGALEIDMDADISELKDFSENFELSEALPEGVGYITAGEFTYDTAQLLSKIANKEIKLADSPLFFMENHGGKYARRIVIGYLAGVPVIGPAVIGIWIFKNKNKLRKLYRYFFPLKVIDDNWTKGSYLSKKSFGDVVIRTRTDQRNTVIAMIHIIVKRNNNVGSNIGFIDTDMVWDYLDSLDGSVTKPEGHNHRYLTSPSVFYGKKYVRENHELAYKDYVSKINSRKDTEKVAVFFHIINLLIKIQKEQPYTLTFGDDDMFREFQVPPSATVSGVNPYKRERLCDIISDFTLDIGINDIREMAINPFYRKDVVQMMQRQMHCKESEMEKQRFERVKKSKNNTEYEQFLLSLPEKRRINIENSKIRKGKERSEAIKREIKNRRQREKEDSLFGGNIGCWVLFIILSILPIFLCN